MTRDEIGELVAALPDGLDADEFIFKLVNWAVDREREACAKREWVGLTDEEIESELTKEFAQWWSRHVSVCRAIEAKLKEKNA